MNRIPLRTTEESSRPQACGDCQACCYVLGIAELQKPLWTKCPNQCGKGCAIYETKPQECTDYWCLFSGGVFGSDIKLRPDKLGIFIDFRGAEVSRKDRSPVSFLQLWETRPKAFHEKRVKQVIASLGKKFPMVFRKFGSELSKLSIQGTAEQIQKITGFLLRDYRESAKL